MTALPDEIGGAIAEGCTLVQLKAPSGSRRIKAERGAGTLG